jgi:hypothetical protein
MRNGENGFIISGGEYLKAASAIHQASNDYDLYCRMSVRAASDARAFSMTKAFIDVLPFLPSPKG